MPLAQFISIRYILFLVLGIVLGYNFDYSDQTGLWISGICLLILGGIHFRKKRIRNHLFEIITAICLVGIGMSAIRYDVGQKPGNHYSRYAKGFDVIHIQVIEELRSGSYNNRYIAKIQAVDSLETQGKILLYTPDSLTLFPNSELLVFKAWHPIRPPMNPGQFNYRKYMALQRIEDEIRLGQHDYLSLSESKPSLLGRLRMLRLQIAERLLDGGLSPSTVATTEALLLGQRQQLDSELYDAYKDAGAVHILAVSGLHIGILVLILKFLLQPIRGLHRGDIFQFLTILTLLWVYALFTGMSPSVVRAVALFSFIGYAWMIKRPTNMYNILALSFFFILLLIRPSYLFQAGFQMSYAAVLAIIWIYPKLIRVWQPDSWILKRLWQLMAVSLSAQLGVLPISLYYFHQFPALFILSNLLIIPFMGVVLGLGILMILMAHLNWHIEIFTAAYDILIHSMNELVTWIGSREALVFREIQFDLPRVVLLYALIISLVLFLERRRVRYMGVLAGIALLFQSWTAFLQWQVHNQESLVILHEIRHSILLEQKGGALWLHTNGNDLPNNRLLSDYQLQEGKGTVFFERLQNSYLWGGYHILIVDESGIVPYQTKEYSHIVLTQNPKIHLDRVLTHHPSVTIIADGSNYPSFVSRWRESCKQAQRSFHYTGEEGAYSFSYR